MISLGNREVAAIKMPEIRSRLRGPASIWREKRGATAIEFGLIAMPFFALICAIFEICYVHLQSETLQGSLNAAMRQMATGQMQTSGNVTNSATFISSYLCQTGTTRTLPRSFNCANMVVTVQPVSSFASADMSNQFYLNAKNPFCLGSAGQIMVARVAYPLSAIFPLNLFSRYAGLVNNWPGLTGWYHVLLASSAFQVENFSGSYTPPSGC